MSRISQSSVAIGLLAFASLTLGFGCHVIAGLEDREVTGGAGGASSSSSSGDVTSSSSSGMASSSSSSSSGMMPMGCGANPPGTMGCDPAMCSGPASATTGCHCGDCGIDCGNGAPGQCLASGICPAQLMATAISGDTIHRVATYGGNVVYPLYNEVEATSQISGRRLDGQPLTNEIITNVDGFIKAIAVDCGVVFFATVEGTNTAGIPKGGPELWSVPIGGGTAMPIPQMSGTKGSQFESIVVDERYVYWTDDLGVGIWEKPVMPGPPAFAKRVPDHLPKTKAVGLAVRGTDIYWSTAKDDETESRIWGASVQNGVIGTPFQIGKTYPGNPRQIGVDDTHVYWVDSPISPQHRILKIAKNSGNMTQADVVFTFPTHVRLKEPIAVDSLDPNVYVITSDTNTGFTSTCRVGKNGNSAACQPHTGFSAVSSIGEEWLVRGGSRLYLATPRNDMSSKSEVHRITVGKLMP